MKIPQMPIKVAIVQAIAVWNKIALNMAFFEPSSRFIAAIAPKHGALNKLKMQYA